MKFEGIYRAWLEEKRLQVRETTLAAYVYVAERHILPHFADAEQLTHADLQEFFDECHSNGLSRYSINNILSVMKLVTAFGAMKGWCDRIDSPLRLPPNNRNAVEVFDINEESRLISHLLSRGSRMDIAILISITSGLRIGEVCGLRWGDYMKERQQCHIRRTVCVSYDAVKGHTYLLVNHPKTPRSQRIVPIHRMVTDMIAKKLRPSSADDYLFTSSPQPLHPNNLRKHFRNTLQQLSLPPLRFHALRHTFATRCIESGCDIKTLSSILGHANVQTTMNLYVHPSMEQKQQALINMMRLFDNVK